MGYNPHKPSSTTFLPLRVPRSWRNQSTNENANIAYRNKYPHEIVEIFEKHGFIWGGRWYHYDTMHFEYRPEILKASGR